MEPENGGVQEEEGLLCGIMLYSPSPFSPGN